MGNTCAGPTTGKTGFFESVTAAVWRPRSPGKSLPAPDATTRSIANDTETNNNNDNKSVDNNNVPIENSAPEKITIPPSPKSTTVDKKPPGAANHARRTSSIGLQLESVLGRKTGNLKDTYILGRKLGQGQFGTTFLCVERSSGKEYACKSIAKRKLTTAEDVEDVRREIQIMHHLAGHPNVINIVGAYEDAVAVHVVMELCAGGELFDRIIQRGHYSERKAAELARVIVGVVEACHSLGVLHRDLKPENFLFVNHDEEAPLKTIDFGLSVFFKPGILIGY